MLLYDAEARKFYNIFDHAKNKTPQKLKNIDFQALKPHLFNWLDIWSKPGFLDEDRLFDCRCLIEESYNINLSLKKKLIKWVGHAVHGRSKRKESWRNENDSRLCSLLEF